MGKLKAGLKENKSSKRNRKKNKEKNLKKKKLAKFKRSSEHSCVKEKKHQSNKIVTSLCVGLEKSVKLASPREIVRAKHRRDNKQFQNNVNDLCDDLDQMCKKHDDDDDDGEEECFAEVETLSRNINDLIISNDNHEPGFRFTRSQQKKFQQNIRRQKIKYKFQDDDDADNLDEELW